MLSDVDIWDVSACGGCVDAVDGDRNAPRRRESATMVVLAALMAPRCGDCLRDEWFSLSDLSEKNWDGVRDNWCGVRSPEMDEDECADGDDRSVIGASIRDGSYA